jgi:hypothetical protein
MYSVRIQRDATKVYGFMCSFRVLDLVFWVTPSTPCRWNSLRHRNREIWDALEQRFLH